MEKDLGAPAGQPWLSVWVTGVREVGGWWGRSGGNSGAACTWGCLKVWGGAGSPARDPGSAPRLPPPLLYSLAPQKLTPEPVAWNWSDLM